MKLALVLGGAGFIGGHLVQRLKRDGFWVRAVDRKQPEFGASAADQFVNLDLRDRYAVRDAFRLPMHKFDYVFQLAAEMGGMGFIGDPANDADILHNSLQINLHVAEIALDVGVERLFFSSSACVYTDTGGDCQEQDAYPANMDNEYSWEKLIAERLYLSYGRCHGLPVRIARIHNCYGPYGTWRGGREKAPAAICRKVAMARDWGEIELWGDGKQTRSFMYVDDCVEGIMRLTESDFTGPVNLGSDEMVTMNDLVSLVTEIAKRPVHIKHVEGPIGVRGRNSDNTLIREKLGWAPSTSLKDGLRPTYSWIEQQVLDFCLSV